MFNITLITQKEEIKQNILMFIHHQFSQDMEKSLPDEIVNKFSNSTIAIVGYEAN